MNTSKPFRSLTVSMTETAKDKERLVFVWELSENSFHQCKTWGSRTW